MGQERRALIAGAAVGIEQHERVGAQFQHRLERSLARALEAEFASRIVEPERRQHVVEQSACAGDVRIAAQLQQTQIPPADGRARFGDRRVDLGHERFAEWGLADHRCGPPDVGLRRRDALGGRKGLQTNAERLELLPCRAPGEGAGEHEVGLQLQDLLGAAADQPHAARLHRIGGDRIVVLGGVMGEGGDLAAVGERKDELIRAGVDGDDALRSRVIRRRASSENRRSAQESHKRGINPASSTRPYCRAAMRHVSPFRLPETHIVAGAVTARPIRKEA